MITVTIRAEWLTNWRPKVVYKPSVVKRLAGTLNGTRSGQEWQEMADMFNSRGVLHADERTVVEATEHWRSWPGAGPLPDGALKAAVLYDDGPGTAIGAACSYADGTDVSWMGEVGDEYRTKRAWAIADAARSCSRSGRASRRIRRGLPTATFTHRMVAHDLVGRVA